MMRVTRSSLRRKTQDKLEPVVDVSSDDELPKRSENSNRKRLPQSRKTKSTSSDINLLSPVTPPKVKKADNVEASSLSETANTPSTLFKKLSLISPTKKSTHSKVRASLFSINCKENLSCDEGDDHLVADTAPVDNFNVKCSGKEENGKYNQYQNARKALHSNFPTDLPGREAEINELQDFILNHLKNNSSGSIYVSGPPGTGKTASLNLILQDNDVSSKVQHIYINCTAIKSASAIYSRLTKELHIKRSGKSKKDNLSLIERYLQKKHKTLLIVLDEIDQLETKNHSILYTIFEWPSKVNSRLILVGIANALDLTDRTLPRLQARCELKPKLLHFTPYTKEQIIKIFTSRLETAGVLEVFSPVALQMLAGKVASISGDVRRALDIGRRVVEIIDKNDKADVLKSMENFTNSLTGETVHKVDNKPKSVKLKEVVSVLNNVYGTTQNLNDDAEESFPLQQKIIICSLLLMLKIAKNKDITVGKLHEVYTRVCNKQNLMAVDQAEFFGLCSLIETKGIVRITGKKEPRMHKVNLEWNEAEVVETLRDKQLMSRILQDESCLGKI